ncbi:hypothetical protein N9D43_00695 [Luminiphilus sp.]|nr:hypothetical protein [Luminiphilus sp.]
MKKQGAVNCHEASRYDHSIVGVLATVMNISSFAIWQVLAAYRDQLSLATIVRRIVDQDINHPTIDTTARLRLRASLQLQTLVNREALSEPSCVLGRRAYEGYVIDALSGLSQEHFLALFLDARNRLITSEVLFYGSVDTAPVYTRVVRLSTMRYPSSLPTTILQAVWTPAPQTGRSRINSVGRCNCSTILLLQIIDA